MKSKKLFNYAYKGKIYSHNMFTDYADFHGVLSIRFVYITIRNYFTRSKKIALTAS